MLLNALVCKSAFVMRPIKITIKSDLNPKGFGRANHVTKYTCFSKLLTMKKLFKNLLNSRKLLTKYFSTSHPCYFLEFDLI